MADSDNGYGNGRILEINPATGAQSVWASGGYLDQPTGIAFDGLGNLIVSDFESGSNSAVIRINLATGQQTKVATGGYMAGTATVEVERSGSYIAINQNPVNYPPSPSVVRINSSTGVQSPILYAAAYSGSPIALPTASILDSAGNVLCANEREGDGITGLFDINSQTGAVTAISTGGQFNTTGASGIVSDPTDPQDVLLTCPNYSSPSQSKLLDVNLATGVQSVVATGGDLGSPTAINSDTTGDIFIANNYGDNPGTPAASVIEWDASTGQETVISSGGLLLTPTAILSVPTAVPEPNIYIGLWIVAAGLLMRRKEPGRR